MAPPQGNETLCPLAFELTGGLPDYENLQLNDSDHIMKRTLSMQIMLSWTEKDIENRIQSILKSFKE